MQLTMNNHWRRTNEGTWEWNEGKKGRKLDGLIYNIPPRTDHVI